MEYVSLVSELNYMTQIVVMLYEDPTKEGNSEERFHVELHFSPGVNCCVQKDLPPGPGFRPHSRNNEQVRECETLSYLVLPRDCSFVHLSYRLYIIILIESGKQKSFLPHKGLDSVS